MIQIHKIEPQVVEHFAPSNQSLGFLNYDEHFDLRCQILEHNVTGYYLIYDNQRIDFDKDGILSNLPSGLYDLGQRQFKKYMDIKHKKYSKNK